MHAQQIQASAWVCVYHHHNTPHTAVCVTLLLAKVISWLLRLLTGQVRQLQTRIPWQNSCQHQTGTHSSPTVYLRAMGNENHYIWNSAANSSSLINNITF